MRMSSSPICLLVASCCFASHAAQYRVTDLGAGVYPVAINDGGQVVAQKVNQTGRTEAFLIDDIGETPITHPDADSVYVTGINNLGQVVGSGRDAIGRDHAFLWEVSAGWQFLLNDSEYRSYAWSINNNGVVAVEQDSHARLLFPDGSAAELGTLGGLYSVPFAVNDSEVAVGLSEVRSAVQREFIWKSGEIAELGAAAAVTHDHADYSVAIDINNSGDSVGWTQVYTGEYELRPSGSKRYLYEEYGFLSVGGSISPMLVPNARFLAIGENGDAFGSRFLVDPQSGPDIWAAVALRSGRLVDLNSEIVGVTGVHLETAFDSNGRGQILASGWFGNSDVRRNPIHGFILTPAPEPTSIGPIALAATAQTWRRRVRST
ncbi:hypothetical protein Pla123a_01150 [Posidoniimonas polymericola]|uniref:Extracellular repeat protein, HAF family n=1 Tax=Posidoniimonas polymericola TaxID=2528002 RepID=A0A5C5ZDR1_9BACT|nr:hypothetical protein [Posidoniimonas polymericola]TWT85308.1 hypothetical protein Pla123a_01150 [Posidoniimonas polymericola]